MSASTVFQVIPHTRPGGMQRVAEILDAQLPSHGIGSELVDLVSCTDGEGPRIIRLVRGWFRLVSRLRNHTPDAVMAHTVMNGLYTLSAARVAGVGDRWLVLHGGREAMGPMRLAVIRLLCITATVTGLVCCGYTVREHYTGLGAAVRRRLHVVQNGVRLPAHDTSQVSTCPDDEPGLRVVTACRLVPEKALSTAIRAYALTTSKVHLTVCGDGPLRAELENLARELDAPVEFTGNIDRAALAERFAAADLFLFPSEYEGLPLALIEAAAAGLPVLASDIPANREVMGDAAIYCPVRDVKAFAEAIDRLSADPQRLRELRAAGLERTRHFSADRMVADYATLLRQG